ncbi:MAG: cadherin-like beta sandwich domain-containing protein, partial [Clostridia bacterium]|nr:cadherin-like beta sandwich domain-containing protein [Clostridia bacterium]
TLAPVFDRDITNYTALVSNAIEEITVTPIPEDAKASLTVTINGSEMVGVEGNYQGTLNTGVNNIAIEVTAEDGETVKTYTITLTRVSISNNANLSNLIIDNGTLAPVFDRDITNYMALVSNAIEEITVTPILEDAKAALIVTINGSETVGVGGNYQATLNTGVNNIAIEVTAEDGETVKTYTVNITRDKSDNANLKTLILNKGRVELGFSAQTTKYDIVVSDTVDDVTVTATSENQQATVAINGKEVANGEKSWPIKLNYGDNTITVQVTAEDGTEKTHTINIYRNKISAEAPVEIKIMGEEYNSIIDKKIAIGHGDNLKIIVGIKNLAEKLSNIEEIKDLKDQDKILIQIIATERCRDLITELSGLEYQDTQTKNIIIQCETKEAVYTIPLKELDIEKIFSNMTKEDEPSDPKLVIQISQLPKEYIQNLAQDNKDKGYQILMAPIKFNIVCTNNNEVYEISRYNDYIERTVKIPEEVNPEEIATAVAINEDGSISHVPTKLTKEKGKYYLKIKSLINGTYSVISREKKFKDIQKHWAEEAINQLGTRCIVGGIDAENFDPQKEITRCEFAAILNRALGLKELPEPLPVIWDITEKDWYYQSVKISAQYGLMGGYSDGKFKPQKNITREEAMVVLARAMKLGGIQIKLNEQELERQLSQFHDSEQISEWAKESAAVNVKYGIIVGRDGLLAPKDKITRAETAVIVTRLLKRAGLI